jgi:NAD(P)H-hydrate repair Nnr-like enzyme with NAD(P)H-hydrate dehydratase domain
MLSRGSFDRAGGGARVAGAAAAGAHKGERGHLGIVGGSAGTPGAAVLAARRRCARAPAS